MAMADSSNHVIKPGVNTVNVRQNNNNNNNNNNNIVTYCCNVRGAGNHEPHSKVLSLDLKTANEPLSIM